MSSAEQNLWILFILLGLALAIGGYILIKYGK